MVAAIRPAVVVTALDRGEVGRRHVLAQAGVHPAQVGLHRPFRGLVADEVAVEEDERHDRADPAADPAEQGPDGRVPELGRHLAEHAQVAGHGLEGRP